MTRSRATLLVHHLSEPLECQIAQRTAALRDSEQRFQDIAEVSGDWMYETNREHRFARLFGQRIDSLPVRPVVDSNGLGYRGTATDETAIVEARHWVDEAEGLLRRVFETSLDLIVVTDSYGSCGNCTISGIACLTATTGPRRSKSFSGNPSICR